MIALFMLDAELAGAAGPLELAWHLRQRDPARAARLGAEACALAEHLSSHERALVQARCRLIDAEARWLAGDLDGARSLADGAWESFSRQHDATGMADAHWLHAWIELDRGDNAASEEELGAAAGLARHLGDSLRIDVFEAAHALLAVFRDPAGAHARWGGRFDPDDTSLHPAVIGWIHDYLGTSAFQASDFGRAVSLLMRAYEAALATGQTRRAVNLATNIGNAFTSLNAHHAALDWMQRGLDLARPAGWPMCVGLGLMQTAETLRQLGQYDAAVELLHEALATLQGLSGSRAYAIALEYQGDLALDRGDDTLALDSFARLEARGRALGQADFQSSARRGQAHALSQLNRPQEALAKAAAALALARDHGDAYNTIAALRVLAPIPAPHRWPAADSGGAPSAALHYLQQALGAAATIAGYVVPGELFDAMAREYAAAGDYRQAYAIALQAGAARDRIHTEEARNRAVAVGAQYQTERARLDAEHHRQLAAAEARRAEVLRQTSATLEHLSAIGQEITTHLESGAVFHALDRHVHGLLDATHFSILLIEPDGAALRCAFGTEAGHSLPSFRIALADPDALAARCVRERREILVDSPADGARLAAGLPALSQLFAPLLIGERVLGVMSVQSLRAHAYGERERLIFRTLCAYGAIALDNASAYRQVAATLKTLSATQAQLVEKNAELSQAYQALEDVSLTDQLTGLRNRRFFLQHVDADVSLSLRRYDQPMRDPLRAPRPDARRDAPADYFEQRDLVFFMVDLDHFKAVNDAHGHAAGDAVLVQMQERLREVFRESDYLIRWGGEEFLVLARATHRDDAKVVAERIRAAVANRGFVLPDGTLLAKTCSIGFACFPFVPSAPRLLTWSQVLELADQALYLVKRSGRNAWAGIYSTAHTHREGLFERLIRHFDPSLAEGEARLVTNLAQVHTAGAAKPRRLVADSEMARPRQ